MISIRASKLTSDSPSYSKKEKTDSGFVYRYDQKHLDARWKLKKQQLKRLSKNIEKLRNKYEKDLGSDDLMTRAVAAVVGLIDDSAVRVGNEDSVRNADTYGATTLKVKHVSFKGKKAVFDFIGKDQVKQHITTDNSKIVSVLKELVKGKKENDFIFEVDGTKIWDRRINRYLTPFKISAKDLRGFKANQLMKEKLKTKDFDEALEEVAEIVGHKASTLKNQYLDPDLVSKYKKAALSIRATLTDEQGKFFDLLKQKLTGFDPSKEPISENGSVTRKNPKAHTNELIDRVWAELQPHLPEEVILTSGIRSANDQIQVINNLWARSNAVKKFPDIKDPTERATLLRQMGYKISSPKTTPHSSGRSFDLSGADLNLITQKIKSLMESGTINAQLKLLSEPQNNAVHIDIVRASYNHISKLAADELESEELISAFKNSEPAPEVATEFENTFGIEQNIEDLDDKEAGKYEREKEDSKWDEILIDGEKTWTRRELRNYYVKNADKILKSIKDHSVMLYLGTGKNKKILKRNHNDKTIQIKTKEELEYWADRRLLSLHLVMDSKTNFGWVDLDRHNYPFDKTLSYAKKLTPKLKEFGKTELWHSGGTGIHIEIHLKKEWNIDTLRDELKILLDEFNEEHEDVSTSIIHGSGLRSDVSTLHEKGNLRAEWSVGETTGNIKTPISMSKRASFELTPVNEKTETATYDSLYNDLNEEKATEFATNKPAAFLFGDDLIAKLYPQLKPIAVKNLAKKEPDAFLLSHFQERPEFKEDAKEAVLNSISSNPTLFFTMGLYEDPQFADVVDAAVFAVAHKDPKFFLTTLLPLERFKSYTHLKQVAENSLRRNISKRAAKKQNAGIFIRVPSPLNKNFPKIKQDASPTHITALYIGNLSKKDAEIVEETLKEFLKMQKPFKVKFAEKVSYFKPTEHSDGLKVAKIAIESEELQKFNRDLKKALKAAGVEIDDHFPTYRPHITLSYIDPETKYEEKIPKGGFKVEHVELWNGPSRKKFKFKQLSKRASALQEFPKTCSCGKHTWNNYEEFFKTPFKRKYEPITPDAHRVQCMAGYEDEGEEPHDFVWGDCECGSSLVVKVPCMHQQLQQEAKDPLATYHKKRDFSITPEPEGKAEKGANKHLFVIQDHHASKHHWDLRLENDEGTMSSWAITKHKLPSKGEKLLAVKTENHPISYNKFHGKIEEGYGKGTVKIHDHGTYELIEWKRDTIKFKLKGKETGAYTLHKMNGGHWILMKSGE